jgi:outer membrane protein assembly factor BamA
MMKHISLFFFLLLTIQLCSLEIKEINFTGNQIFTTAELLAEMISFPGMVYNQKIMLEDAERIADFYRKKGFYLAKVLLPQAIPVTQTQINITIAIEEGANLLINNLTFSGNNYISEEKLLSQLNPQMLRLSVLPDFLNYLIEYYNDNSFFFASAVIKNLSLNTDDSIDLTIAITEGDYCRFSQSIIHGNTVSKKESILLLGRLGSRQIIKPAQLKQAENNIIARPYIISCQIVPLNSSTLLYDIKEGNMTAFSGILGYNNDRQAKGKFTGYIEVDFQNLWGTDRSVGFFWENRQNQHSAIELNYHESGWNYPFAADLRLYREEMDSTWIEVKYESDIYWYDLFNKTGIYLEKQNIFAGSRRPKIIDEVEFYKTGAFWKFSTYDHPLNPSKGISSSLKYYYIFSNTNNQKSGKQAVEMKYQKIFPLFGKWLTSANTHIKVIENKNLTEFDKFEAGGANSIRGFLEKQFSGYRVGWLNLELRYLLAKEARLSLNADLGNIENMKYGNDTIYSLGCGIRTSTPLGQLALDFAVPADKNGFQNPLDGIVHFGFNSRF